MLPFALDQIALVTRVGNNVLRRGDARFLVQSVVNLHQDFSKYSKSADK